MAVNVLNDLESYHQNTVQLFNINYVVISVRSSPKEQSLTNRMDKINITRM